MHTLIFFHWVDNGRVKGQFGCVRSESVDATVDMLNIMGYKDIRVGQPIPSNPYDGEGRRMALKTGEELDAEFEAWATEFREVTAELEKSLNSEAHDGEPEY